MKKTILVLLCILCTLSAGAKRYPLSIASFGNYDFFGKKIVMSSLYEDTPTNDPEFCYYAQFVASCLLLYGAQFTFEGEKADVCILLGYGVKSGQKRVESDPIYATVPSMGVYMDYWGGLYHAPYGYHSQVVGYNNHEVQEFDKFIEIQAYEAPADDNQRNNTNAWKQVWKMELISTDDFNDLHAVFPYMIHGSFDCMGKNAQANIEVNSNVEEMLIFQKFKRADLCTADQVVSWPDVDSLSEKAQRKQMDVVFVELRADKTVITIYSDKGGFKFGEDTYLQVSDQKLTVTDAENITLGCCSGKKLFSLIFPKLPTDVKSIDIVDEKFQFYGIRLNDTRDRRYSIVR